MEELNYCTANPLRSLDIVTGETDMKGLGEVVRPPRLLAGGRGQGVWQLRPAPQQRVRAVNLPRSSQLSHVQVEIIPVTTLSKQTYIDSCPRLLT